MYYTHAVKKKAETHFLDAISAYDSSKVGVDVLCPNNRDA